MQRRPAPPAPGVVAVALGLVYVLWGSTYLGIRVALDELPPMLVIGVRFTVAGGLLLGFTRLRGTPLHTPLPTLAREAVVGFLLLGLGTGGIAFAEQHVATGVVALLVATTPLWMALLGRTVLGERLGRLPMLSLLVGFAGVAVLVAPGNGSPVVAMLLTLVAPLAWSTGSIVARSAPAPRDALQSSAWQMLIAGVVVGTLALVTGDPGRVHHVGVRTVLAIAYLVTFGSFVGYTAYAWLLRNVSLPLASTYAYVNPVVALVLGTAFLGERITGRVVVGGGVIAVAVALIVSRPSRPRQRVGAHGLDERAPLPADGRPAA